MLGVLKQSKKKKQYGGISLFTACFQGHCHCHNARDLKTQTQDSEANDELIFLIIKVRFTGVKLGNQATSTFFRNMTDNFWMTAREHKKVSVT